MNKAGSTRITLRGIENACAAIDPVFLNTPQFYCEPLNRMLGCELLLKIETMNPIRSFKGRGADWLCSKADPRKPLVCASAGNFGQAMAYACRKHGIALTVFASVTANTLKVERMKELGAQVILTGDDFDSAKTEARQYATRHQRRFIEDSLDIETVEGAGTIALELVKSDPVPDYIIVPIGNGAMLNGIATVFKALCPATKIVGVQAQGAPAMIESYHTGTIINHASVNTIADGIAVRLPVAQALNDMRGLLDDARLVSDEAIIEAMKLLHRHAGLVAEPSAATGIAAMLSYPEQFRQQRAATIICGGNVTATDLHRWVYA